MALIGNKHKIFGRHLCVPFAGLMVQIEELAVMVQKVGRPWWMSIKSLVMFHMQQFQQNIPDYFRVSI